MLKFTYPRLEVILFMLFIILIVVGCKDKKLIKNQNKKTTDVSMKEVTNLVLLKNGDISVTVLPGIGGRIVSLQKNNGKNILKSDTTLWDYKFNKPVSELILKNKIPFNGHIVWVGPQSEWWLHQEIKLKLKKNKANWPPDPYLIYGDFRIVERNNNSIKMKGPKSKYTGVLLTKNINLKENGKVVFTVDAENILEEPIAWDLWLNTRMDGFDKVYVPVSSRENVKVEYRNSKNFENMPYKIENGFFYFETIKPTSSKQKRDGKAFIYPSINKMFAFTKNEMFVIKFNKYDKKLVHPEQGLIEIYNSVSGDNDALMELEYHTPYKEIAPNGKISGKEVWEIHEYRNSNCSKEHINFINVYLELNKSIRKGRKSYAKVDL